MNPEQLDLWNAALVTAAMVGGPLVGLALVVGLVTSFIQAATQLQENALSFVPKVIALGLTLMVAGPWMLDNLVRYTKSSFGSLTSGTR